MAVSVGPITLTAPNPSLIFQSMTGKEELGRLFEYNVVLLSDDPSLKAADLLGKAVTVHVELADQSLRHFNGYVTDVSLTGSRGDYLEYSLTLRPWLWFLTRAVDCRIFQRMSVLDVIKKVFRDHGFTDFEESLTFKYEPQEYIVQYRETDFQFVSRLLERAGIYYYFKHTESRHSLVLGDSICSHENLPGYKSIRYAPPGGLRDAHLEYINEWSSSHHIQPGAIALNDYDFERPKAPLLTRRSQPASHPHAEFEVYDYPGGYTQFQKGRDEAQLRLEQVKTEHARAIGHSNVRALMTGALFTLADHPVSEQNREYLVVSTRYQLRTHDPRASQSSTEPLFQCSFSAIDSTCQYRSARVTPWPVVGGPQTAVVVGKAGEEIWTDEHARVKVKFHWDRDSEGDENSSCWVRVAQYWAGDKWGSIHIPRIGQEVIVDFLEGDPDHPIITGRVYNGLNKPPYALPANRTQSGVKSRSSKRGNPDNFNEIRFEDAKGSEELYIQAEKDKTVFVKNDRSTNIVNDDKLEIGNDRTKKIGNNETIQVGVNRKDHVGVDEDTQIGANRKVLIGANLQQTIGGNVTETIAGNVTETVGGNVTEITAGSVVETIAGSRVETIAGGVTINTPAAVTIAAAGGFTVVAPGGTKTVDSQFLKTGGATLDIFALKMSVLGAKTDLVAGLSLAVTNNKVDFTSMKVDQALTKFANSPVTIESKGMAVMQGYVNLHTFGLLVIS